LTSLPKAARNASVEMERLALEIELYGQLYKARRGRADDLSEVL
jgi:hypothetical protein